jgi:hypothetical protein
VEFFAFACSQIVIEGPEKLSGPQLLHLTDRKLILEMTASMEGCITMDVLIEVPCAVAVPPIGSQGVRAGLTLHSLLRNANERTRILS